MATAPLQQDLEMLSLNELPTGEWGTICEVEAAPADAVRLMGLGICAVAVCRRLSRAIR